MLNSSSISRCNIKSYPQSTQFDGKRFNNKVPRQQLGLGKFIKLFWDFTFNKPKNTVPDDALPLIKLDAQQLDAAANNSVYRLGHSSLLFKMQEKYWLIDPVFTERASPFKRFGPKRFQPTPIQLEALPPIEGIILSHDHYDHLDYHTIMQLKDRVRYFLTPLGVGDLITSWGVAPEKITQLDWWESKNIAGIQFVATPSQHFSGRGIFDGNKRLWCSWSIISEEFRLFFGSDSGYFDGFKQIGHKFGPFDMAFLENGAYDRRWADIHMLPQDTIKAFLDLNAKWLFPIHNATFDLAFHPWNDPLNQIVALAQQQQVKLSMPKIGQGVQFLQPQVAEKWW
ncbi:MBL fold metallo-hydrolase [Pantoea sp. BIGb0393]|uniref:MBL fold metallo-hydrolase n=1 Tax=Pantoea nemavictus TaxID=2726955 RepID=A0ABU8PZS6_9GAMM|nr:MBL fold metallo-hydrolase [Pantoea nemavictus]MBA0038519.1 MBL fold metallo-hydrolase [Pantoea nemavictus]